MSTITLSDFLANKLDANNQVINELSENEKSLYDLHAKQIYAICCRDAHSQFDSALRAWRKHPDSGICLMLSTHYGARHLANIWQGVLDYFEVSTAGPSLETMIEAVMSRGLDPRIQFAGPECRSLLASYLNCQSNPEEALESWINYSGAVRDRCSYLLFNRYVSAGVSPSVSREYLIAEAHKSIERFTKHYTELNELFHRQYHEIANASRDFRVGKTLLSNVHHQVSRNCLQVLKENIKIQHDMVRDNDKLLRKQFKSKDYSEEMLRLTSSAESLEKQDLASDEPPTQPPPKKPVARSHQKSLIKMQKLLKSKKWAATAANVSEINQQRDLNNDLCEVSQAAADPEIRPAKPDISIQQASDMCLDSCGSDQSQKDKATVERQPDISVESTTVSKPASSGRVKSNAGQAEPNNAEATTNARQSPGPMGSRSLQTTAHADAGETDSTANWHQADQESIKGHHDVEIFRKILKAAMSKPPPNQ